MPLATVTALPRLTDLQTFVLTHARAREDAARLAESFPRLRFIAAPERWADVAATADAFLLTKGIAIDEVLDRAPQLRWIHNGGAGVDRALTPRLRESDVVLTNSSGVHAVAIPEHVLALMFAFARQLPELGRAQAERAWRRPARTPFELQGQTLAVVGLGAIGRALAEKAAALGLTVVGVRRSPGDAPVAGVTQVYGPEDLDRALAGAHHVAICLPLTEQTRGLFDDRRFAGLRPGAYLYNIGRGPIVDQAALRHALDSGKLAGAGLDVTVPEPLPADAWLWNHPRVVLTNHTAGASTENGPRWLALLQDNIARALRGDPLRNVVDKERGY